MKQKADHVKKNKRNTTRRRENREEEVRYLYHLKLPRHPIHRLKRVKLSNIFNKKTRNNQKTQVQIREANQRSFLEVKVVSFREREGERGAQRRIRFEI